MDTNWPCQSRNKGDANWWFHRCIHCHTEMQAFQQKCRPGLFKRLRKTTRKVNTSRLQTFRRMILLLSILPTPYERSQESSEHQPRHRMFHASSPPQAKTSTDYKRDARADAFTTWQLDRIGAQSSHHAGLLPSAKGQRVYSTQPARV